MKKIVILIILTAMFNGIFSVVIMLDNRTRVDGEIIAKIDNKLYVKQDEGLITVIDLSVYKSIRSSNKKNTEFLQKIVNSNQNIVPNYITQLYPPISFLEERISLKSDSTASAVLTKKDPQYGHVAQGPALNKSTTKQPMNYEFLTDREFQVFLNERTNREIEGISNTIITLWVIGIVATTAVMLVAK